MCIGKKPLFAPQARGRLANAEPFGELRGGQFLCHAGFIAHPPEISNDVLKSVGYTFRGCNRRKP